MTTDAASVAPVGSLALEPMHLRRPHVLGKGHSLPAGERVTLLIFGLLVAAALFPVLTTRIPAMVDYPNHLARMFVIERGGTPFYHLAWAFYPNLAMDLIIPGLGHFIGVEAATRAFLLASDFLIVGGAVAIELAVKRRLELSGFVALLTLYSLPFAWGFLNFEFALGLALWGIAGWLALGESAPVSRLALHCAMVAGLFVSHLFALGIYGFALGVHELWTAGQRGWPARLLAARALVLGLPVLPVFAVMILSGGSVGQEGTTWSLAAKPLWLFGILNGYSFGLSALSVTVLWSLVAVLVRRRAVDFAASGLWMSVGFGVLYLAMPFKLFDTAFVDMRVLTAALLILPAFMRVSVLDLRWKQALQCLLALIVCLNLGEVIATWRSYAPVYDQLIASFQLIPKGSRVLVGATGDAPDPPLWRLTDYPMYNAPTLAVHFADALVPTFFTSIGKQPVSVDEADRRLTVPYGGPVPLNALIVTAKGKAPAGTPSFIESWPRDFDFVYLVGDPGPNPMPKLLTAVSSGARFTLYRIAK